MFASVLSAQNPQLSKYHAVKQKYQLSRLLEKFKPSNQKTNQFNLAYTYFEYDTIGNFWIPAERYTEWVETFPSQASKLNIGLKVERFNSGVWKNADSIVFMADTAIDRFKIPDEVGLVDTFKLYLWNDTLMNWELQILEHLTLAGNQVQEYNGFVTRSYLGVPGNTFINLAKTTFSYQATGQINYYIKSLYSFASAVLQKQDSIRVQVDQNGFPRELTTYKLDISPPGLFEKELLVNDIRGNIIDQKYLTYDSQASSFDTLSRYVTYYDQNRNILSDTSYIYFNNVEQKDFYSFYTYQQGNPQDYKFYQYINSAPQLKYETDYFYTIPSQLDSLIYYDYDSGIRKYNGKEVYQYAPFVTKLDNRSKKSQESFFFYPNPTTDVIRFEKPLNQQIDVFDINGRIIRSLPMNITEFNLSKFDSGIYFLRSKYKTQKLIKY